LRKIGIEIGFDREGRSSTLALLRIAGKAEANVSGTYQLPTRMDGMSTSQMFEAIRSRLLELGFDKGTVFSSAMFMINNWSRFLEDSEDEHGNRTYRDCMDKEIVRLLDGYCELINRPQERTSRQLSVFEAIVSRLLVLGDDNEAAVKRATWLINNWRYTISEKSQDEFGHQTCRDWMDGEIVRLLDEYWDAQLEV
jgi:hypothetical protein